MKTFVLALVAFLPVVAGAADRTLDDVMKDMGPVGKFLKENVSKAALNEELRTKIALLQQYSNEAKTKLPKTITDLPANEQPAKILEFRKLLLELTEAEAKVEAALLEDKNADAQIAYDGVRAVQAKGHKIFNPPPPAP